MKLVSVICPIYNEEKHITSCIVSVLQQDFPKENLEILFVDGMSTDKTRRIISDFTDKYKHIRLLDNPQKTVPYALNIGIQAAKGDIIIRMDAHAVYPHNYFSILAKYLTELNADNVGGVCRTLPANNSSVAAAIADAVSCVFGVGNSHFRIGTNNIQQVDTVPFGCWKKEIFEKIGYFDTELTRNQDDEFNGRIIKNGGKIYLIPDLFIDYFARENIRKVSAMHYQYGLFKPLVNKKLRAPATVRQFFPALFVAGLIAGIAFSLLFPKLWFVYFGVIILYALLALYFSLRASIKRRNWKLFFMEPIIFFLLHTSYGLGYWAGLYKVIFNKKFNAEVNR